MKELRFSKTIIFLIAITFFLFLNINQAKAQCNIIWRGDGSGSALTNETSQTETATFEAFVAIFGIEPNECGLSPLFYFCTKDNRLMVYNDEGSMGVAMYGGENDYHGYWDVVCTYTCEAPGVDSDVDGICDDVDNCLSTPNHLQQDADNDTTGDACDDDIDGDTVLNTNDNCPNTFNPNQEDFDNDGIGDVCDDFDDTLGCNIIWWGDESGYTPTFEYEVTPNAIYEAYIGIIGYKPNDCGDGYCTDYSNLTWVQSNPKIWDNFQEYGPPPNGNGWDVVCTDRCERWGGDSDVDGICDYFDNCISTPNHLQKDLDSDGIGNVCDDCLDIDDDGQCAGVDNCPYTANPNQEDADSDGTGDACDPCPLDPDGVDTDSDGVCDDLDNCPAQWQWNQKDTDSDGIGDWCDPCPLDPDGVDTDNDGICEDIDNCPAIPNPGQEDEDNDGEGNACEHGQCYIIWWGQESGYIPTFEYEITPNAIYDAFIGIIGGEPDYCEAGWCTNSLVYPSQQVESHPNIGNIWWNIPKYGLLPKINGWDVVCTDLCETSGGDSDVDGICDNVDNCISTPNHLQQDADNDTTGDACDNNTIYGNISGAFQEGITVNIYIHSCGALQPHATATTDAQGYYATGDLPNARYLVVGLDEAGYSFSSSYWVDIPQVPIQPYGFIRRKILAP